jgi:hypothetical protein
MKWIWNEHILAFERENAWDNKKEDFTNIFGEAYLKAFQPETIKKAFREMGVWPVDRTIISENQMKPSKHTSINSTSPLSPAK